MSLEALKQKMTDPSAPMSDREHAFYNYWMQIATSKDAMSRDDISEMLTGSQWIAPLGEIVAYLCSTDKISLDLVPLLKDHLPVDSFATKQLMAFEYDNNAALDWRSKYLRAKELRANWAIARALRSVSSGDIADARQFIESQGLGKGTKRWQLEILSQIEREKDP